MIKQYLFEIGKEFELSCYCKICKNEFALRGEVFEDIKRIFELALMQHLFIDHLKINLEDCFQKARKRKVKLPSRSYQSGFSIKRKCKICGNEIFFWNINEEVLENGLQYYLLEHLIEYHIKTNIKDCFTKLKIIHIDKLDKAESIGLLHPRCDCQY